MWDIGWGRNSKKRKEKLKKGKTSPCKHNSKNVTQKSLLFCFLRGQRTTPLLSPTHAELKTGRGRPISVPLLIQNLRLHIEKESQSWLMATLKHRYFFDGKTSYVEVIAHFRTRKTHHLLGRKPCQKPALGGRNTLCGIDCSYSNQQ